MGRSPSLIQPRPAMKTARPQGNVGAAAGGAAYANPNRTAAHPAGAPRRGGICQPQPDCGSSCRCCCRRRGYANRNQGLAHPAGAAAAGAGYANRNQYDQYHPGMTNGYWNGNYGYGAWGMGAGLMAGVGMWGLGSACTATATRGTTTPTMAPVWGRPGFMHHRRGVPLTTTLNRLTHRRRRPSKPRPTRRPRSSTRLARPSGRMTIRPRERATSRRFGQMPNDATLHEFLSLVLFAQGKYEPATAPLYAVLSVGPGWDWTTLIGNYADATLYTTQLRALEAYVNANPKSAQARFVLAYHYITQGHGDVAANQLKEVVALQPNDTLSAQLLGKLRPATGTAAAPTSPPQSAQLDAAKLIGNWSTQSPQNAKITLSIKDGGGFTWAFTIPGKPPTSITGTSTIDGDVLSLASKNSQVGPLTGQVAWQDDAHFVFKATGAPADDPGLKFAALTRRRGFRLFRPISTRVDRWIKPPTSNGIGSEWERGQWEWGKAVFLVASFERTFSVARSGALISGMPTCRAGRTPFGLEVLPAVLRHVLFEVLQMLVVPNRGIEIAASPARRAALSPAACSCLSINVISALQRSVVFPRPSAVSIDRNAGAVPVARGLNLNRSSPRSGQTGRSGVS